MKRMLICLGLSVAGAFSLAATEASAETPHIANHWGYRFAMTQPWNKGYYHPTYGHPISLVVPPTANNQVKWGWGVAQSESVPIYHQYQRAYTGGLFGRAVGARPTPYGPSHTDQFGVYYVRGPW